MVELSATAGSVKDRTGLLRLSFAAAAAGLLVVLWGGYDLHWNWTGFRHNATLWDWLHIFLLPLAVMAAPFWIRNHANLEQRHRMIFVSSVAAFATLVVLGYALDLGWTGFPGNELWDWLELLLLPLAVGLLPIWSKTLRERRRRHVVAAGALLAAFAVAVAGGYGYGWHWTGFRGNTLFDWLQLFVAPLILPIVLVPFVREWMATGVPAPAKPQPASDGEALDGNDDEADGASELQ